MSRLTLPLLLLLLIVAAPLLWSQSIDTDGDIQTGGQLVSTVPMGTPPMVVSSTTKVSKLNADLLDGYSESHFFSLDDILPVVAFLDNPDPPCWDTTHRFVDCGNGTLTDTSTGLIWLEDADCFAQMNYQEANEAAAALWDGGGGHTGGGDCGLSDGSRPGDWRLASKEEFKILFEDTCDDTPYIIGNATSGASEDNCYSNYPWAGTLRTSYWTMEAVATIPERANKAVHSTAYITSGLKNATGYSWPVRGPMRAGE